MEKGVEAAMQELLGALSPHQGEQRLSASVSVCA